MPGYRGAASLHVRFKVPQRLVEIRRNRDQPSGTAEARFRFDLGRFSLSRQRFNNLEQSDLRWLRQNLSFAKNFLRRTHDATLSSREAGFNSHMTPDNWRNGRERSWRSVHFP